MFIKLAAAKSLVPVSLQVLEMLQRFKDSTIKREREVFNCMLRNLFEEYRFFPQYPDKELHITACLFGGIIEKGLVTYMALGLALRYVLEALRKPFGSKMYYFGIAALDRFKNRYGLLSVFRCLMEFHTEYLHVAKECCACMIQMICDCCRANLIFPSLD